MTKLGFQRFSGGLWFNARLNVGFGVVPLAPRWTGVYVWGVWLKLVRRVDLGEWRLRLTPWPVYFVVSGTDCDRASYCYVRRCTSGREALREWEESLKWCDGVESWSRCTRLEYNSYREQGVDNAG